MIVKNDNDDEHDINDNTKKNQQKKKKKKKLMPQLGRPTEGSVCFAWILLKTITSIMV